MGKKNKKWKKKNKHKNISYFYSKTESKAKANSFQVNQIAYQVFGSLYYTSQDS